MRAAAAEAVKQPKHMLEWTHAYDESMRVLCSGRERGRDRERRGEGYRKRREMMDNEERWMESLVWVEGMVGVEGRAVQELPCSIFSFALLFESGLLFVMTDVRW